MIWDAADGAKLLTLEGHAEKLEGAEYSPDGHLVATASEDRTASGRAHGESRGVLAGHEGGVTCCSFSPDGLRVITGSKDKTARVWDARLDIELHLGHARTSAGNDRCYPAKLQTSPSRSHRSRFG
ncbi:hypothetical protein JL720_16585 [Aureococcus anophagefferens]|nr:hypothetical protein JL720_16585 [Aureococcus anophagefferens]